MRRSVRWLLVPAAGLVAAVVVAGCASTASAPTWTFEPVSAPSASTRGPAAAGNAGMADMPGMGATDQSANAVTAAAVHPSSTQPVVSLDLTIVTGDMTGHTEYPAYIPSDFTLPAYSTVVVTITNFDDATPLAKDMAQYATVAGTGGGTMRVTPIDVRNPNSSSGPLRVLTKLDPATVSHTFTIPALGINVPLAAHARTVFTIQTGAPRNVLLALLRSVWCRLDGLGHRHGRQERLHGRHAHGRLRQGVERSSSAEKHGQG